MVGRAFETLVVKDFRLAKVIGPIVPNAGLMERGGEVVVAVSRFGLGGDCCLELLSGLGIGTLFVEGDSLGVERLAL